MKVLLSTPPGNTTELWPPLGLLYIASSLRATRSDTVRVIDAFCENLSTAELVRRVAGAGPDVFGINCSTHTFLSAVEALKGIREAVPDATLVLGGYHATFAAERILRDYPFVDFVLKGEAERSFPELLDRLEAGTSPASVEGISYLEDGRYVSQPLAVIRDLDALPFPDRRLVEGIPYGYYHKDFRITFGKFTTLCSSRGCPFQCTYCSCAAFSQRRWRSRSAENVVDEIELLRDQGFESAVFVDDNFTLKKSRVERICDLLRERRIRMRFYCEGRVDNAPYALLRTMKRAGFEVIYFGVESASRHVLDYYKKGISADQSRRAIDDAKRAGMVVLTSYIIGAPVESREDVQRTIDFIASTRSHGVQINILDCLVGTPIWEAMVQAGIVAPDDWKRNHRIYEYNPGGLSRAALEELQARGYRDHLKAWKNRAGLREFFRLMRTNRTGRKVILGNILRIPTIRSLLEGLKEHATGLVPAEFEVPPRAVLERMPLQTPISLSSREGEPTATRDP